MKKRSFGFKNDLKRFFDLTEVSLQHRLIGAQFDVFRIVVFGDRCRDIFRDINKDRARSSCLSNIKGFFNNRSKIAYVFNKEIVFYARSCDADNIDFLERVLSNRGRIDLTGKDNHRDTVRMCRRDAGYGVGRSGSARHQCDADFIGSSGVCVSRMNRALLVTNQNVFEFILFVNSIEDIQYAAARISEHVFNTFFCQSADKDVRAVEFFGGLSRLFFFHLEKSFQSPWEIDWSPNTGFVIESRDISRLSAFFCCGNSAESFLSSVGRKFNITQIFFSARDMFTFYQADDESPD